VTDSTSIVHGVDSHDGGTVKEPTSCQAADRLTPRTAPKVSAVEFRHAHHADQQRGLLGWASFVLDDAVLVDGVALRRTRAGRLVLSFPDRRHPRLRPVDDEARRAIERQVFAALDAQGVAP
jgi:hypothetical protein